MDGTKGSPVAKGAGPKGNGAGAQEKGPQGITGIQACINDYVPDVFAGPEDSITLPGPIQDGQKKDRPGRLEKPIEDGPQPQGGESMPEAGCQAPAPEKGAGAGHQAPGAEKKAEDGRRAPSGESPVKPQRKALTDEEVTGHTASLWKYLPVPLSQPEPAPEYLSHFIRFPGSRVVAARVRGKKHKHEGTNCDDWYEVANLGNITLIAVSDGAGSKKFSRIGARESCKAAVGYLSAAFKKVFADNPRLWDVLGRELSDPKCMEACGILAGVVQGSVLKAIEAVEAAYYSRAADPAYRDVLGRELQFKDLSATLLLAVLIPIKEGAKEHLAVTCQVGDGMIALINTEGDFSTSVKLMGVADSGDYSGETEFLTSPQMRNVESLQSRTKISRGAADLALVMSDGVADDYFPNETEMHRLYFDLVVNGVLKGKGPDLTLSSLAKGVKVLKRIPDPLAYPWVNDPKVMVAVHYTKRICQSAGLSLEDLWNDPSVLALARYELEEGQKEAVDPGQRLQAWLDNYVERGSFDDRTLVVAGL